jgi:type II restriction/modification system DNA methylase subunit YeeA
MNKANLKLYAPQARKDFIAAVTARANLLGLSERAGKLEVAASLPQGDVTVIAGQAWPAKVHTQRDQLISSIRKDGFAQTMEAVAYTWFNRFAALRYMELHGYLDHGHRALSSTESSLPEILTCATDLAQSGGLPGLKSSLVTEMKLAGNRDGELYRMLLVAQCNALSAAMPFLFERIDDETELLLPDNLLRTDSVISKLVTLVEEDDWEEVEIIGWLYQFYISEKKDEVIGKVVKSEDIPAATQLFTPSWIVQYLVQNSVGRLWLMANPASTLKAQWPYYIEPAQQTPEVQAQLDALIQTRMDEDGGSLNPESITLLDPACGSGHILVVAYDVFKAIYLERGYQPRAIPRLILEKNLYGLDIDDRAAQMAGFALMMKARADDRRLFNEPIKLNVFSLQESKGLDVDALTRALQTVTGRANSQIDASISTSEFGATDLFPGTGLQMTLGDSVVSDSAGDQARPAIAALIATFSLAKTLGSLIQIPQSLNVQLAAMAERLRAAFQNGDLYAKAAAQDLWPLAAQAQVLGMRFDAVVANPPYLGGKGMNAALKNFAIETFPESKSDLFSMFIERGFGWCKSSGFNSMVTMQSWMFLTSFEAMRKRLLKSRLIQTMAHLGARAFSEITGEVVQTTAFVLQGKYFGDFKPVFLRLVDGQEAEKVSALLSGSARFSSATQDDFEGIPGSPLAYWADRRVNQVFRTSVSLFEHARPRQGLATTNDDLFLRRWHEVSCSNLLTTATSREIASSSGKKWFPFLKGGGFRKWYGNNEYVVNFGNDGKEVCDYIDSTPGARVASNGRIINRDVYFKPIVTWTLISGDSSAFRYCGEGFILGKNGPGIQANAAKLDSSLAFLNSVVATYFLQLLSPTISVEVGQVAKLPIVTVEASSEILIQIAREDWDSQERSWDFKRIPWVPMKVGDTDSISSSWTNWLNLNRANIARMQNLEQQNNRSFISAYGLLGGLSPEVPESQITLARADREKDCQRLMSYAVGCMMGRYSLDAPGLMYAQAGNIEFDASRYIAFPADADGIVPLTDELWFEDDAASRIPEFLLAVWGADTLTENLTWLAESLGVKASETSDETIRRYLADKFYKDHLQTYKKRPIYWLFSSGKQGAFQALVYLHRYHEGTLARLRAEYVVPLTGKIQSRIDMLQTDAAAASSTAARNKLAKEVEKLKKKHVELLAYDEQLRHYADMRITLDLDDGVKVNYGKFGNLLDCVNVISSTRED